MRQRPTNLAALCIALLWAVAAPAYAQPIDWWMVLPVASGEQPGTERRAAEQLVPALKDRRVPTLSLHQARDAFERTSREPNALDPTDIDLLAEEAYEAVRQVAFGNRQAAARTVSQVMQRAERAMETLNRETKNARYVLDACLALVRSTMSRGDREGALAEAMRCRRIVPDVTPSELMHPPSVIGVLAEADDQLRRMQIGHLTVESTPEAGCSVYLNGRHLGTTPFKLRRAAAGEYRVQVECGERAGRVHTVQLGDEAVNLQVDTVFDQSIRSRPALELRYPRPRAGQARLVGDAQKVAEYTGAFEVVLVSAQGDHEVRLRRVSQAHDRVLADVVVGWQGGGFEAQSLRAGLDALLAGRLQQPSLQVSEAEVPLAAADTAPATPTAPPASETMSRTDRPDEAWNRRALQLRVGTPLAAAGAGLLAAGWVLYADAREKRAQRDAFAPPALLEVPANDEGAALANEVVRRNQAYDAARLRPTLAFAGGALAAGAMPFLLPDERAVPWYGWAIGAVGAGAAAVGFWQLSGHDACTVPAQNTCLRHADHLPLMSVSFATALPLLAVPLTFALRMPFAERAEARWTLAPTAAGGATLMLRGMF